jgi:replicative DNA helicase
VGEGDGKPSASKGGRVQRQELFISYSRKDRPFLEQFWIHLKPLETIYGLQRWDDSRIQPGDIWLEEIEGALERAQVALLLVSPNFLASEFIQRKELPSLLDAAKKDGLKILWLPIRPCSWKRYPQIEQYQSVGSVNPTLAEMDEVERDRAMVTITDHIHDLFKGSQKEQLSVIQAAEAEALGKRETNPPPSPQRFVQDHLSHWIPADLLRHMPDEVREKVLESIKNTSASGDQRIADNHQGHLLSSAPAAAILTSTFEEIETRSLGTSLAGLLPVNFYDLDAMTQGLQRGDLLALAGRQAMGKTSFALNIARNVAQLHKLPVCIFSLEMSKEQLTYRLLSMEVGIESGRLRTGRLHQEEWPLLGNGISELSKLPLYINDKPNAGVLEMHSLCRRLIAETGKELGLVVIDCLQLMEGGGSDNRVQELSRITRSLKGMARELNVPVMALSQLSREVESRINKRPMLSDLRESGSIEQDADLVMMIYRDEYYNPETPDRGVTEVIITKHRNGPVGTCKLFFEPQFTRFRNLASPDERGDNQTILLASDNEIKYVGKEEPETTYSPFVDGKRIDPSDSVPVYSFDLIGNPETSSLKLKTIRVVYDWRYFSKTSYKPARVSFQIVCSEPNAHSISCNVDYRKPALKSWTPSTVDIDIARAGHPSNLNIYVPCPGDFSFELKDLEVYGILANQQ